ncbi:Fucose permease [Reichenbachiella agariperforans]|uniref:Fucose permease n=1 Tax=Reichenbachiella agariperforans TaxID=156994 RepID=A0A1M6UB59_REIAG|nr:MFS transporter [Reichenbachiella agariperforans]SHK66298.1 Fucose permease [Reichenbachiella agariperforans]
MNNISTQSPHSSRAAVSIFFLIHGINLASWASRIPDIKAAMDINDAQMGTLLLVMPISSLLGLAASSWILRSFDNKVPLIVAMIAQSIALACIGISSNLIALGSSLFFMALAFRVGGIAMNTQAVILQKSYAKPINGSFHAMWSFGGILAVGLTSLMIALDVPMHTHLIWTSVCIGIFAIVCYPWLPSGDRATEGSKIKMGKPDKPLFLLGVLILLASFCEGGMFDWSGVYFKDIVNVEVYTAGYFTFMICMTIARLLLDKLIAHIDNKKIYIGSSLLIVGGILLAVLLPNLIPAMIGFSVVGMGTAVVIPTTFLMAGDSKKYSAGMAISIISSYSVVGMLFGPPLIGFISEAFGLQVSFLFFALMGLLILPVSLMYFHAVKRQG